MPFLTGFAICNHEKNSECVSHQTEAIFLTRSSYLSSTTTGHRIESWLGNILQAQKIRPTTMQYDVCYQIWNFSVSPESLNREFILISSCISSGEQNLHSICQRSRSKMLLRNFESFFTTTNKLRGNYSNVKIDKVCATGAGKHYYYYDRPTFCAFGPSSSSPTKTRLLLSLKTQLPVLFRGEN